MQTEFGLGWSDYGARMYDAALGRFHQIDPKSEIFIDVNPYNYAVNNPIIYIDENGEGPINPVSWKRSSLFAEKFMIVSNFDASNAPTAKDTGLIIYSRFLGENSGTPMDRLAKEFGERERYVTLASGSEFIDREGHEQKRIAAPATATGNSTEDAARLGNYDLKIQDSNNSFRIQEVTDGIVSSQTTFEKNSDGEFEKTETVKFQFDYTKTKSKRLINGKLVTIEETNVTVTGTTINHKTGKETVNIYEHNNIYSQQVDEEKDK